MAIAYGRPEDAGFELDDSGHMHRKNTASEHLIARRNEPVRLLRFANRVPLLYQQSSCAITKAVVQTNWRAYGLQQTKGAIPIAPMGILVQWHRFGYHTLPNPRKQLRPTRKSSRRSDSGCNDADASSHTIYDAGRSSTGSTNGESISRRICRISASHCRIF